MEAVFWVVWWVVIVVFGVHMLFYVTNPRLDNKATYREWWDNRPTFKDPNRWQRFCDERGIKP